jgi:hypothetical protein
VSFRINVKISIDESLRGKAGVRVESKERQVMQDFVDHCIDFELYFE